MLTQTACSAADNLGEFLETNSVLGYDRATTLAAIQREFPDLVYSTSNYTHDTLVTGSGLVEKISFTLYKDKLTDTRIYLRENAGSSSEIASAVTALGYNLISERDNSLSGNHSNGSTFEASTSRRHVRWSLVFGAADHQLKPKKIAQSKTASAGSLGKLSGNSSVEVLQNHLRNFIRTAPLFQFGQNTPISQVKEFYPEIAPISGKVSEYAASDTTLEFIDRLEFHTENDGKRLTWIGVYFKPNLDQASMSQAFSSVLEQEYGKLVKDDASEHLARRKDFSNAFHTRWYFRQKQWGAGIYPPK